jgi:GNAT superfamily N-acetyltransferase
MEGDRAGARPFEKFSPPRPLVQSGPPANATCRRATAADVAALVDLRIDFMRIVKDSGLEDEAAWRAELAELFGRDLVGGELFAWVAEEGGRVVAASGLRLLPRGGGPPERPPATPPPEGEILNMYTVPSHRRLGLGSELLGLAIAEARARGLSRLRLQPTDDGRPLYLRAGFRDEGRDMVLELADKG